MASSRVNVLVYSGPGTTVDSVRHTLYSLRRLLSPNYAVIPVGGDALIKEPWTASCALLVIPGGADLPVCRALGGAGNRRIKQFVQLGGSYLGLCSGGYYACKRVEFMLGTPGMEVAGDRELGFFPGVGRGIAFPGFQYQTENGTRAAELVVHKETFSDPGGNLPTTLKTYFNGGGVFVDAESLKDQGVEVLASYVESVHVDSGKGQAAVVYRKVGEGHTLLTGPHPEFAAVNLSKTGKQEEFGKVVDALAEDDKQRVDFFRACLIKLGLRTNDSEQAAPSLSRMHFSSIKPTETTLLLEDLKDIIVEEDGRDTIKGANDTFILERPDSFSMREMKGTIDLDSNNSEGPEDAKGASNAASDGIIDYNKIIKRLFIHDDGFPTAKETPYFDHAAYFSNWAEYVRTTNGVEGHFGKHLWYGEVVTSTSTMLDKNPSLLRRLHTGVTTIATTQTSGRGRGTNVWVSPPGCLLFSFVLHHSMEASQKAPVVFIQYLAALAIARGIRSYAPGYTSLPVKLKWPNDIYARDPTKPHEDAYVKIGGILVNSSYSAGNYDLVVGIGLNLSNASPTTSLNALAASSQPPLAPLQPEKTLARVLTAFESIYYLFCRDGWTQSLEEEYYANWLHSDQIVTLEMEGGARARIKGITRDWGLLVAEELGWEDRGTGKLWQLQSDSNSFDFLKGLLRRKI